MRIPRPSHSTVVAYLALFAALGGSAYAVAKIGTKDLRRSAVTSAKIKKETIRGSDVRNDNIGGKQIDEASLKLSKASQSEQAQGGVCTVNAGSETFCATTNDFRVPAAGTRLLAVAYGAFSGPPGTRAVCRIEGMSTGSQQVVLEGSGAGSDAFSVAAAGPFDVGVRKLSLVCAGSAGSAEIEDPRVVALGL